MGLLMADILDFNFFAIPLEFEKSELAKDLEGRSFIQWMCKNAKAFGRYENYAGRKVWLEPFEFICGREKCSIEALISKKQAELRINKAKELGFCKEIEEKRGSTFSVCKMTPKGQQPYEKGQQNGQQNGQ